jgi:SAM-dependent methyltransferase
MKRLISLLIRFVPRTLLQRVGGLGLKATGWFYRGTAVMCPVCNTGFRKFLPYGRIIPRENALCPNCLSLERHRLLWLYLKERTPFFSEPLDVLHIAPEACFIKRFQKLHRKGYVTADIESPLATVKMDIQAMPFGDNRFDVVLCNHVLEHVDDDMAALREIRRVLKPGGFAILQVPFFNPVPEHTIEDRTITDKRMREQLFGQADHVRRYGKDYAGRIRRAGLAVTEDLYAAQLPEGTAARYGISTSEIIYKAVK